MRNYGQHNATLCGVRDVIQRSFVRDHRDDGSGPTASAGGDSALLSKLNEGFDVVYGAPRKLPQGFYAEYFDGKYQTVACAQ
jgi:hypothetical protein